MNQFIRQNIARIKRFKNYEVLATAIKRKTGKSIDELIAESKNKQ